MTIWAQPEAAVQIERRSIGGRVRSKVGIRALFVFAASIAMVPVLTSSAESTSAVAGAPQPEEGVVRITGANTRLPVDDLMKGRRHFAAGAHTAWHIHPGGQLILVEEGIGFVQRSGGPIRILHAGESDFTPAGVAHWHGAAPGSDATMALVHFGGIGPFLDSISPQEYAAAWRHPARPLTVPKDAKEWPIGSRPDELNYVGASNSLAADDMEYARGLIKAGGRTWWHIHPTGQLILVERGTLLVQRRGEPVKVLKAGESDFTPPGIAHWHGATSDSDAQAVVVNFGGSALWLEPVSDASYAAAQRNGPH